MLIPDNIYFYGLNAIFLTKSVLICEPEYDFEVISLVSSVKDYRLCWLLNRHLKFDFSRVDDLMLPAQKKKKGGTFSNYFFYDEMNKLNYFLLANKDGGVFLLPELKQVDYIIKLEGFMADEKKKELLEELKLVPYLETVFGNSLDELKSKANLLF